jgi:phage tail sheath gpL-like
MSGSITIPGYPASNRVPGVFAVVDASRANSGLPVQRTLLLGQMIAAGNAAAGSPTLVAGLGDAITQFGAGSHLAVAFERYRALDTFGEVWALPMADVGGSVKATGTIAFTGTATAAGVIPLYVNGTRISVPVASGDTATVVGASAAAAVNAYSSPAGNPLSVTAAAATGTVTLTARNGGTLANSNTIMLSYLGTSGGEGTFGTTTVPGITAVITGFASGATDPVLATSLANLPSQSFDFIYCPYNDTTSLNAMRDFLSDASGRWNWANELFGHAFTAKGGSLSTRATWSTARNDQHMTAIGANGSPSPDWAWSVDLTAAHAVAIRADPSLPVGGLGGGMALRVLAPLPLNQDVFSAEQTLLSDGMSTYVVANDGLVRVHRSITTYQLNPGGAPDNSYLDTNVPFQLMAYIRAVRTMLLSRFNQVKLVIDGSRIPVGQAMVTSQTILFSVIGLYRNQCDDGLVQDPDGFAREALSQNAGGGVVKMLLPVRLANQLYVIAMNVQFTRP